MVVCSEICHLGRRLVCSVAASLQCAPVRWQIFSVSPESIHAHATMGQQKVPPAILTPLRRVARNPSIISYRENVSDRKALRVKECLTGGAHTGKILSAFTDVAEDSGTITCALCQ